MNITRYSNQKQLDFQALISCLSLITGAFLPEKPVFGTP
jgi:hypothetical protein